MITDQLTQWAVANPWPAALLGLGVLAATALPVWGAVRVARRANRPPLAVIAAGVGAIVCTAYSGDTSWRFAEHHLGMTSSAERVAMFAAGEVALFACALMARQGLQDRGTPGAPGLMVWAITAVQVIPAYTESGPVGGSVRAVLGPILAAVLWHFAMGLELWHAKPGALSSSLPAVIAREVRERLLSRLGLATRDRTALQITRDRWTARAVDLAARLHNRNGGWDWYTDRLQWRLDRAVGRAGVGASPAQRRALLQLLATRLHSSALPTLDLPSPWVMRAPERTPHAIPPADAEHPGALQAMDPMDAVLSVAAAHPRYSPEQITDVLSGNGVVLPVDLVKLALRFTPDAQPPALGPAFAAGQNREAVHAYLYEDPPVEDAPDASDEATDVPTDAAPEDLALLPEAHRIDQAHQTAHNRPAGLRTLQTELRIGQDRARRVRALLNDPRRVRALTDEAQP